MKILVTAMALVLAAAPAAAQTAPAQHQDPQQHQASQSGQHQMAQHAQHAQHQGAQGQHQGQAMQDGCCADRNGNGQMDCCENMPEGRECCCEHGEGHGAQQAQPSGHQNH
jgi:Ni/Co efflux regulator RcnB